MAMQVGGTSELNSEINAGGFTVLDREASQLIQLCAHALSVQVDL